MEIEFQINLDHLNEEEPTKDGQINVKIPKDQERRFKALNVKYNSKLSDLMRDFAFTLMDKVENHDKTKAS